MTKVFHKDGISGVIYSEALWVDGAPGHDLVKEIGRGWKRRVISVGGGTGMRFKGDRGHHEPWGGAPRNTRRNRGTGLPPMKSGLSYSTRAVSPQSREFIGKSVAPWTMYVHEGTGDLVGTKQKRILPKNFGYKKINLKKSRTRTYRGQRANPFMYRAMVDQGRSMGLWTR